jgi:PAS domain S-box-containing protein
MRKTGHANEVEELRRQLEEAQDALRAIRKGEVDAVVVAGPAGEQVYVLNEGAATILRDGTIVYNNERFAKMLGRPLEQVMGASLVSFLAPDCRSRLLALLEQALTGRCTAELPLLSPGGAVIWAELSMCPVTLEGQTGICLIATDITERKKTEELRAYLASIVDNTDDAIVGKGLDGTILSWNRGAERLYGYSAGEIIGQSVLTLCPPDRVDETLEILQRITRGESVERHETERIRKGGQRIDISLTVSPIRDLEGRIEGIAAIARDITGRKQAEERLRQASAYTRSLIEASLDPLVTIDRDGKITDVNQSTEVATGLSRQELIGTDFSDYFTDPQKARDGYRQVFREGGVHDYELEICHRGGRNIPVLYNASLYRDETGAVAGVFAAARDVSAIKRAGVYTRSLIEASPDPLVTIAPDGTITDVNTATEQATGCSRQELIGTDFCDYFTDPQKARDGYRQAFREGRVQDYELEIRHRDGHLTTVLYNASVYRDQDGNVSGVFAAARNITVRKQAQEALARRTAELERSNAELQQFAYVASHDLQEPLRAVASFTKLLAERYHDRLDADANDFIGFAVDGARRAQQLINDLLAYSRVGTRGKPFAATNCETVLENALTDLAASLEESRGEATHDPLPTIDADETQFGQLFRNLIGNALKFHGAAPPRVHLSAERIAGGWRFSVRDNGIGIDPQYAEEIFKVFQRLHTSAEYPGTGIGLAIAKKIVERHGGRIWVESEAGQGSTFFFTVPVKRRSTNAE